MYTSQSLFWGCRTNNPSLMTGKVWLARLQLWCVLCAKLNFCTRNCKFERIRNFWGNLATHTFADQGKIPACDSEPMFFSSLPNVSGSMHRITPAGTEIAILADFWKFGAPRLRYQPPFVNLRKICQATVNLWCALACQISRWSVHRVAPEGRKNPKFNHIFKFSSESMVCGCDTFESKMHGRTTTNLPLSNAVKRFPNSNGFTALPFSQSWPFKSVTDIYKKPTNQPTKLL